MLKETLTLCPAKAATMVLSTYQKICEVVQFRNHISATMGPAAATLKAVAEAYKAKGRMAKTSEDISDHFLQVEWRSMSGRRCSRSPRSWPS